MNNNLSTLCLSLIFSLFALSKKKVKNFSARFVIVKVWFLRALSDLSARASGRVGKNSARERSPSALILPTRPEASADKSDNARRNHTLIVLLCLPVEINAHARIPCVCFKMAEGSPDAKS